MNSMPVSVFQVKERKTKNGPRLSRRGEIRMGFRCNARCGFCYYKDLLDNPKDKEPKTEKIFQQLRSLRVNGASEVEFTGGEPTIKPDLWKAVAYAKELGFVNVSLVTNGIRLAKRAQLERLADSGLNDILFSVHGHTAELHDQHTSIPGSFEKLLEAISHAKALGLRVRTTTTITSQNHLFLETLTGFLIDLEAECINVAVFNPVAHAEGGSTKFEIHYSVAAEAIKRTIDFYRSRLPLLSVKYIPFCFMNGYEEYVMNLYQQSYDPDDWNYYLGNKVRRTSGRVDGLMFDAISLLGVLLLRDPSGAHREGLFGLKVAGFTRLVELLRKKRLSVCKECRYDPICDHISRGYSEKHGLSEVRPIRGEKLVHPAGDYLVSLSRQSGVPLESAGVKRPEREIDVLEIFDATRSPN